MGCAKPKSFFEHAQNVWIQIIMRMIKVSSGPLFFMHAFYSIQYFCWRTVKALIRLRACASWSGPLLYAYARRHIFAWCNPYQVFRTVREPLFSVDTLCFQVLDVGTTYSCEQQNQPKYQGTMKTETDQCICAVWSENMLCTLLIASELRVSPDGEPRLYSVFVRVQANLCLGRAHKVHFLT